MPPAAQEFVDLAKKNGWRPESEQAFERIAELNIPELSFLTSFDAYGDWLQDMVTWAPEAKGEALSVYDMITQFYFVLDQELVKDLLSTVTPGAVNRELTPLWQWILDYDSAWGA